MDILAPWAPSLDGKICEPSASYESVVADEARPNSLEHPDWVQKNLEPLQGVTSHAREALWDGILALWRLNLLEKNGKEDASWGNLVSAWLVRFSVEGHLGQGLTTVVAFLQHRHRDLCRHFEIRPFKVVEEYANALRSTRKLPPEMLPSFDDHTPEPQPQPQPQPQPKPQLEPEPEPEKEPDQGAGPTPVTSPSMVSSDDDDDDVLVVRPVRRPAMALASKGKHRERARPVDEILVSDSELDRSNDSGAGTKRGSLGSLSPVSTPRKRVRRARSPSDQGHGIDLSGRRFLQDSRISEKVIPLAAGKVGLGSVHAGRSDFR